ncbi:hypothetical protein BDA99DRAFT_518490 [Phascolomyces articulosus]|uniref:NEDD8-activating enzyme E1 catalytic subunit n=1 Tax=Phascolomyces articulosus TaxID=60185 RepID=A0AAD5PB84_9FUNG|nr:hypothetical protein BDA99DRAFT_518490 [Phascolomyces articulosus]
MTDYANVGTTTPSSGRMLSDMEDVHEDHEQPHPIEEEQEEPEEEEGVMLALDSPQIQAALEACKILVIGAGGLGCEILKNLALTGFKEIHVIDMDTIDLSNLNRQFLFRPKDVGQPKATVAAEFVMQRVPGVKIVPYFGKIQDKDDEYYSQFQIVICGLDSIEARRWINAKLVEMIDEEDPQSLKPLIDGGTEGFKGQARVILPTINSCYECSLDMFNKPTTFPICTIANTPRLPEHCIEWASVLEWPRVWGKDTKYDTDNPEHISWLYRTATERAEKFNISGVTYSLTQGVVKNIIPAIASTNAIIAASCCNEVFKIATGSPYLDNYMMYTGNDGIYTYTFQHQKKPECPVCGQIAASAELDREMSLEDLIESLKERPDVQLKRPSLRTASKSLYMQAPPALEEATRPNLEKKLEDLIEAGEYITVTDVALPVSIQLKVSWKE